ncbi:MAG: transposase [Aliishimia sp.]
MTASDELPNDIAELKAIIRAQQDQNARLEALVASFKKALFGSKSEKIDPAQYELELEDRGEILRLDVLGQNFDPIAPIL